MALEEVPTRKISQTIIKAVEKGEARSWHTLVYGLTLALYSLHLRQGLSGYAWQTIFGFIHAAARSMQVSEQDCRALLDERCEPLPAVAELLISNYGTAAIM